MSLIKGKHRLTIECLSNLSLRFLPEGGTKIRKQNIKQRMSPLLSLLLGHCLNLKELVNKSMPETQVVLENGETDSKNYKNIHKRLKFTLTSPLSLVGILVEVDHFQTWK